MDFGSVANHKYVTMDNIGGAVPEFWKIWLEYPKGYLHMYALKAGKMMPKKKGDVSLQEGRGW